MNIFKRLLGRDLDEVIEEALDPANADQYTPRTLLGKEEEEEDSDD